MTDDTTEQANPGDEPSAARPAAPVERRLWRHAGARAAGWLRAFWYGFQRLFGLDSCPIEQGPGAWRPPSPPSPTGRAHHGSDKGGGGEAPEPRSGRGTSS